MGQAAAAVVIPTPASKLRPPRVRHAEITRTALLQRPELASCEVLAICAAAGYGKSTLAIQWASRGQRAVVWATLDESDSDPVVLLATLCSALRHAVPGFGPVPALIAEEPTYSREVLPGFLSAVSALAQPVTVVLDDVHTVTGDGSRKLLRAFVDALPIGSQIALLGRSMQCVPVPLWRGQGRLCELHAGDLAFRDSETESAVASFGSGLSPATVHEASTGWPVAVFLLSQSDGAVSLTDIQQFIEAEVLDTMDAELRAFVMATAALGTVNVDLAGAVSGSASALHYLTEAITTVLIAPDDAGWYRYHPLMQDAVLDVWHREDPSGLRQVLATAAQWYSAHGFADAAVTQAIASGDAATLGEVVWDAARHALLQGRTQTVLTWLERIGAERVDSHPALSMTAAWAHVTAGQYGHVLRHAQQALHLMPADWLSHAADFPIGPSLALLIATSHYGLADPRQALELSRIAVAGTDPNDLVMPLATLVLALNLALVGEPAEAAFEQATARAQASAIPSTRVEALALWGLLLLSLGQTAAGCQRAQQAVEAFAVLDLGQMSSTAGIVALTNVALAAMRGSPDELRAAMARQAAVTGEVEKILAWYKPLSAGVLAFASARLGDHLAYHEHMRWHPGEGLCQRWSELAEVEYAASTPVTLLTPAELRVWELLKGRMTLSEIAGRLYLSRETVKSHTGSIYRKLGVASRREAQELAEQWR